MCKELNEELAIGRYLAIQLIEHMQRMGADQLAIPVGERTIKIDHSSIRAESDPTVDLQRTIDLLRTELVRTRAEVDLRSAQCLMAAAVLQGNDIQITREDPRWTPALEDARILKAELTGAKAETDSYKNNLERSGRTRMESDEKMPDGQPCRLAMIPNWCLAQVRAEERKRLRPWRRHHSGCYYGNGPFPCTCGLAAALEDGEE